MPNVSFKDTGVQFEVQEGEVLYQAFSDRGIELPHGCLSGSCGACHMEILSGKENLSPPGRVEQDTLNSLEQEYRKTRQDGQMQDRFIRLSCRAQVKGDVVFSKFK